ncbi:MAG TPA: polymer-forming cytoskeletal protein [Candidatus Dormibacteraeota bacterium]|nr:polymer-forming cytoskeletal protein [Candidatus Dormibacteraeota bacterium]
MSTRRPASRAATPVPAPAAAQENGSNGSRNSVVLGPKDRLVGQLYIEGDLRVSGSVDGALEATGDIEIAGAGKVNGAVTAYNRLVVGSDASLIGGDVRVGRLTVEDGATFTGRVTMGKHEATVPREPEPVAAPEPAAAPEAAPATTPEPVPETPAQLLEANAAKRRRGR